MSGIDLHLHTSASDGRYQPEELVALAAKKGLSLISITDHDTVDGVQAAIEESKNHPGLTVIPGVELSTNAPGSELHLLGYFIDYRNAGLVSSLSSMRSDRGERARAIVKSLNALGSNISWDKVHQIAGASNIGRPHIAIALIEEGFVQSFEEAFDLYLAQGKPAYVERIKITPAEGVKLILKYGGLPVLAHPLTVTDYPSVAAELTACGLAGIEVYYKDFTRDTQQALLRLADKLNLIVTGGSDYHGIDESIEVAPGEAGVPASVADNLLKRAR